MKIAVLVAPGSEDIETVVPTDLWRRAGISVTLISILPNKEINLSNSIRIITSTTLADENLSDYDAFFLPGGSGIKYLDDEHAAKFIEFAKANAKNEKIKFLAICAAASKFGEWNMLTDISATGYPGTTSTYQSTYVDKPVVVCKNFITSQGPGTSFQFALAVISECLGKEKAEEIKKQTIY
ncbi:MAG: DJ-1/PfpI family protein [Mycoplasmataceae bacterium]|nr:DJ-1/PfpI family protein [Mycoplasmataceae bacterium]